MPTTTVTTAPNVAAIANLTMDQGSTFSTVITVYQNDSILDLAGYSAAAQIRKSYSSSSSTAFTTAIDSTTSTGKITLSLTPTQTAALEEGRYVYDVEITASDSTVTRPIQGTVTVRPNVTR